MRRGYDFYGRENANDKVHFLKIVSADTDDAMTWSGRETYTDFFGPRSGRHQGRRVDPAGVGPVPSDSLAR